MSLATEDFQLLPEIPLSPRWPVIVALIVLLGAVVSLLPRGRTGVIAVGITAWLLVAIEGTVEWLARVSLAILMFSYLVIWVIDRRLADWVHPSDRLARGPVFFFFAALGTSVWLWADGRVLPAWLMVVYAALLVAVFPVGVLAANSIEASAVEAERRRMVERERREIEHAAKAERERIAAERAAVAREQMEAKAEEWRQAEQARRAAEQAQRDAERARELQRESRHNDAVERRQQAENEALRQARAQNVGLGADGFIERTRDILHHLYDLTAGHTNAAIPLADIVGASGVPSAQALLSLRSAEDSEWVAIDESVPRRFARYLFDDDYPTENDLRRLADWTDMTIRITRRGKERVEMETERTVHYNQGDGYVFVQGGDRPRIKVEINKQIATHGGREEIAEALLLLHGHVEAADIPEKARARGRVLLSHIESELADDEPDAEIVRTSLEGLQRTMADAGETFDAAEGWVQRLSRLVTALSKVIPDAAGWLS